jgi:hypothetical protein
MYEGADALTCAICLMRRRILTCALNCSNEEEDTYMCHMSSEEEDTYMCHMSNEEADTYMCLVWFECMRALTRLLADELTCQNVFCTGEQSAQANLHLLGALADLEMLAGASRLVPFCLLLLFFFNSGITVKVFLSMPIYGSFDNIDDR